MKMLVREASQELVKWQHSEKRKPLLVVGARQVGKTSLIRVFGVSAFRNIHEFNFESTRDLARVFSVDLDPRLILQELSLFTGSIIDIETDLLFFDEIQACPAALTSLKYFAERMPQCALIAAGSLLGLHMSPQSFPVGMVDRLNLNPLSFGEFLTATAPKVLGDAWLEAMNGGVLSETAHSRLWRVLLDYLVVGGMPEVVVDFLATKDRPGMAHEAFQAARRRQRHLLEDTIADMAKHSGKINAMHIEHVWNHIPMQLARAIDGSIQRFHFKGVIPGLNAYRDLSGPIDWLTKARLILRVPICDHAELPLAAFTKDNRFKLYVFDTGLLGCMIDLAPKVIHEFSFGTFKGFFIENFVAQELVATGNSSPLFSWSEGDAEVEFTLQGARGPLPVEVKSGQRVRSKSLRSFLERYRPPKSLIISGKPLAVSTDESIKKVNLPIFLAARVWRELDDS